MPAHFFGLEEPNPKKCAGKTQLSTTLCVKKMKYSGRCKCGNSKVSLEGVESLGEISPRICDCDYCNRHPSSMISEPSLDVKVVSCKGSFVTAKNGSDQAIFYHCNNCNQLVAVGAEIAGKLRGALNATLLKNHDQLGPPVSIQPRLLAPSEKLERWLKVWSRLSIGNA